MATLIERAASIVRNSLHRSWHAREQSAEQYGLADDGVRMVMSEFGIAAYDIWRTGADQRATETLHPWRDTMADRSVNTTLNGLRGRWQRMLHNRRSMAELAACPAQRAEPHCGGGRTQPYRSAVPQLQPSRSQ
jgi:hypothetical protein